MIADTCDKVIFPASSGQERMWFLEQLQNGDSAYNIPMAIRIKGDLNAAILEKSLHDIVQRHEVLRTNFEESDAVLQQIISPSGNFKLQVIDLSASLAIQEEEILAIATGEIKRPFDLLQDCLFRATVIKVHAQHHLLILSAHHIIFDGWSIGVLFQELKILYYNYTHSDAIKLPDLIIQYADFTVWQNEWLKSEESSRQLAYWKAKLGGSFDPIALPTDRPRPAIQTYHGAKSLITIKKETFSRLKLMCRMENCTVFMIILAALKTLLYRYTGQEDILIGSPFANRNNTALENQIGFFVNTIVLRTDLSGNPGFREVLSRVRKTTLESYSNQDIPFGKIIDELMPERDVSRNPMFQVMLQIFQDFPLELNDLHTEQVHVDNKASQVDLALHLWDDREKLAGHIEYNTDLFNEATINRFKGHFLIILESILEDPEEKIAHLRILTKDEYQKILIDWNDTKLDYDEGQTLIELFEKQVINTPHAIAVDFEGQSLTYEALNHRANHLAHYLISIGAGPETMVGICIARSPDMMVGLFGVLKAGGAYVPLDPYFPLDRLSFMITDANLAFLVTQRKFLALFPTYAGRKICLDEDWKKIAQSPENNPGVALKPQHLAYVIYTSGSTGKPKGVEVTHSSLVNFLIAMQQKPGMHSYDVLLSVTTLSFDIAALELYLPLITGAKLLLVSHETVLDGKQLLSKLQNCNATVMQATPSAWRLLLEAGWKRPLKLKMLCGGEALSRELAKKLLILGDSLWNMYGPTETTIWSSVAEITDTEGPVYIGPPIANTCFYILDHHLQPVPAGVSGELHIGGAGLARGYLHRPELNKQRFISNPFSREKNSRLYKTGDLVCYHSDGHIEFLGRIDHQVKIRGFRIELEEIESVMRSHPLVKHLVVIDREDILGDRKLVAYVVTEGNQTLEPGRLKEFLKKKLPDYMIPSWFVCLDKLPMTPNGKIDRKALPKPEIKKINSEDQSFGARDALELQLAIIWKKVLGIQSVGIHDNFFETGGHSLLAAKLFAKIELSFGIKLPLAILFQAPTIAQIAEILKKENWKPNWSSLVAIQPGGSRLPMFLVHGAEGNVLLYRKLAYYLDEDQPVYGIQSPGLNGDVDKNATFEKLAEKYIREIQLLQPEGPYFLGGYCLGGTIAFEMARQLKEQGHEIGLLALLESYNVHGMLFNSTMEYYNKILNFKFHLNNFLTLNSGEKKLFFGEKASTEMSRIKLSIGKFFERLGKVNGSKKYYPHIMVKKINDRALFEYLPKKYNGEITLFKPRKNFIGEEDPLYGWSEYAQKGVKAIELPVLPRGMLMEPFVKKLAGELRTSLNACTHNAVNYTHNYHDN